MAGFKAALKKELGAYPLVYNPMSRQMEPWINIGKLERHFSGKKGGCAVM